MGRTGVSVPEPHLPHREAIGVRIAECAAEILELAALRAEADALAHTAAARGTPLPALGRVSSGAHGLTLAVRPGRWLLLCAPGAPGTLAQSWQAACAGRAAVVELSAALRAFHVSGRAAREMLKRGCRLDLDPRAFANGAAAATFIMQLPVIIAAPGAGVLLLTPSSTAQHFREWLQSAARPFGLGPFGSVSVTQLSGESLT
jgi:heterotetrameric sarcosine oxidase gamma subunit